MANFWKTLEKPITILAPMDDVTDVVFREIVATIAKPDVFFTEFTSVDELSSRSRDLALKRLKFTQNQRPIVAQLWGSDPEKYTKASKIIKNLGFDGIDINMGCPDRSVMKKKAGAALIKNKELAGEIIDSIREGSKNLPLSVKTRLDTNATLTDEWLSFLLAKKLDAVIIHGRSASALSKGEANWEEIGRAVEIKNRISPETLIIGNGDVKSYKDVLEKNKKYSVDGVMIGRGVFSNPWIFDKWENPPVHCSQDYLNLLRKHLYLFNDIWGTTKNYETMKKFFKIYVKNFDGAAEIRMKLMATKSIDEAIQLIDTVEII